MGLKNEYQDLLSTVDDLLPLGFMYLTKVKPRLEGKNNRHRTIKSLIKKY